MRPAARGSRSSADLPTGTLIAGFRVERVLGRGSRATVYEATQLSLDRRVALKVMTDPALADRVRGLTWPEHPGAVSLFGVGESAHGPWLAMQLVPGGTLETHRALLDEVAAALGRAHSAGIVHGDVSARNVLVRDGRAYLSDFGLAGEGATPEDDRAALADLVRDRAPRRSRRRDAFLAGAALALSGVVLAVVLAGGDDGPSGQAGAAPLAPPGTRPIGSNLAPGRVSSVDCNGRIPDGASLACTISQRELAGRAIVVPRNGTITSWAVRGASGTLSLQVLRGRGSRLVQVVKSADEAVSGAGVHVARTNLAVAAGDRLALEVAPGSAVGIRRGGPHASTERWFGPLVRPPRLPERPAGSGLDRELLLRVDVSPEAGVPATPALRGERAAGAVAGRRIALRTIAVGRGEARTVVIVVLGGAVAVDLFDGTRRLARAPLSQADGRGQLVAFNAARGAAR
ncbi:MAG: serine/threonine-protein kinase PpkA, partial [Solirubrobacteraceae bacterium]|nr:serine/threonine-protein kinase PpkA [Solirubrobacteraceae bacterium]